MDCDDDDNSHHNLQLTGDSRSKSSVVLRPYDFPKFDFDDSLQSHLRFDTLVETEVFLGIQSQEDNQWIEDFSRGTNGMEFNSTPGDSSCPISKRNNVWSEATSSESVEMLLKSVGQEEMIPGESSILESNVCRDPSTLANCVEPGSKLDAEEGENHANSEIKSLLLDKHVEEQFPETEEPPIMRENLEPTSGENVTSSNEGRHPCHDENVKEFNVSAENLAISKAGDDSINFMGNVDSDFGMFSTTEVSEQVANVSFEGPNGNEQSNEQEESKISEVKTSEASVSVHNAGSSVGLVGESGVLKRHDTVEVSGGCVEEDIADRITDDGYELKTSEVNGQSKSSKSPIQMGKDEVEVEVLPTNIEMSGSFEVCRDESAIGGFDQHHAEIGSQNAEQFVVSKQMKDAFMPVNFKEDIDNTEEAQISASKGENTCEMPWVSGDNNKALLDSHDDVDVANVDKSSEMLVLSSSIESTSGENEADIIVHCHDDSSKSEEKSATQLPAAVLDGSRHVSVSESELDICETSKDKELPTDVENVNLENPEMPLPSNDWINPSPVVDDGIEEKVVVPCMEIGSSVEDGEPEIAKSEPAVVRLSPTDNLPEEVAPEISSDVNIETEVVNAVEDEVTATGGTVEALLSETIVKPRETSVENDVRNNTESHSAEAIICLNLNNSQDNSSLKESVGTDLVRCCGHQEEMAMKVERDKEPEQCAVTEKASCGSPTIISSSEHSQLEKDGHEDVRGTKAVNQFVKAQTFSEVPKRKDTTGDDSTFTFKVDALPDITEREPGKTWSPLLNAEKGNSPVVVVETKPSGEGKSARTPKQKTPHQNARTSAGEHLHGTPKGTSERKGRRASSAKGTAKENVKKGNQISDVNTEGAKVDKVSSSGIHAQSEKRQLCKRIEQSKTNLCGASAVPNSNNSASNNNSSRQPFTDLQQVQLRAQIFVYGSLIQGTAPDEACMVSAFGSSDGRSVWEAVWRAAVERVRSQKSNSSAAETPLHSHTVTRASDVKPGLGSSMATSSSVARLGTKGTPTTIVNPIMPLSPPLWSISTPSRDSFPLNSTTHKGPVVDYQHAISPLHSFQTPPIRNFVGHTLWPSQPCFPCPWLASPQSSTFNTSGHFQPVTMTETVKLTPVSDTSKPLTSSVQHVSSSPPVQSVTPSPVHVGASLLPDSKTTASAKGHSVNSKSRKRKKNQSSNSAQISLLSEARTEPAVDSNIAFVPSQSITVLASSASDTVPSKMASPVSAICLVDQPQKGNLDAREVATCSAVETLGEVAEAKSHADDAAAIAAATVSHNEHLWRKLTKQKVSELTSEVEAKLASAAAAISLAASLAKAAAAAAKVAFNIALQAKLMADEASNIDKTSDLVPSGDIGSATPASKAATAASKQAENVDAIAKAVELATAAVSQAGKIVAMGEPLPLSDLIEAGSEGYWSRPFDSAVISKAFNKEQFGAIGVKNRAETPKGSKKDSGMTVDHSEIRPGVGTHDGLANGIERSVHASEILQSGKEFKMFDNAESCEMGSEPLDVAVVENNCGESVGAFSRDGIREGSAVEVYKCGDGQKSAWFSANVLTLEHGKAYVRYEDLPSEEGSGNLCEWVQLEGEGDEAPVIRTARPLTALQYQGTRKRRRAALGDYAWSIGDRVDVWIDDRWREGVVTEKNEKDATTLKVNFPAHGETLTVRTWNLRMSRLWKDGKWVEWSSTKGHNVFEQSDTPQEKRQRRGSLTVLAKGKDKLSNDAVPALGKPEQSKLLDLSVSETKFDIGKITKEENKRVGHRPLRSGQPKEGSRVVFGVPKPTGKKRKFMEVSKQFPANNSEKKNEATNSVKFAKLLKPQPRSDSDGKQTLRRQRDNSTSARNVNLKGNGKGTQDCVDHAEEVMEKSANDSSASGELVEAPLSSLVAQTLSSSMKKVSSFNFKSEPVNRGKPVSSVGKLSKIEEEDKEAAEPRRSNRRIQPTHRLLESLQSSIMIPKMPAVSLHSCQRKANIRNVFTKGK